MKPQGSALCDCNAHSSGITGNFETNLDFCFYFLTHQKILLCLKFGRKIRLLCTSFVFLFFRNYHQDISNGTAVISVTALPLPWLNASNQCLKEKTYPASISNLKTAAQYLSGASVWSGIIRAETIFNQEGTNIFYKSSTLVKLRKVGKKF